LTAVLVRAADVHAVGIFDENRQLSGRRSKSMSSRDPNEEISRSNLFTLSLIRSIVVSAKIEAGENLSPGASAAIAWRTIGEIETILTNHSAEREES
jgi:hypothetical protein